MVNSKFTDNINNSRRSLRNHAVMILLLFGLFNTSVFAQLQVTNITWAEATASLKTNRDRLLDSYAYEHNKINRQAAWLDMTNSQKGVFLTITDFLGRRTLMHNNYNFSITLNPDYNDTRYGCVAANTGVTDFDTFGVSIYPAPRGTPSRTRQEIRAMELEWGTRCEVVSKSTCVQRGKCISNPTPRTDFDMALNHVVKIYDILGDHFGDCGGIQYNRMFFSVDDEFIYRVRNIDFSAPLGWGRSTDPAGPHPPFTQSRETTRSYPSGQMHEWAWDYEAQYIDRLGIYNRYDPHTVEMDIDYQLGTIFTGLHPSNPECSYNGISGRQKYENYWYSSGLGGSAEFDYSPF
jgi:hypothetical protein